MHGALPDLHTLFANRITFFLRAILCNRDDVQYGAGEKENNGGASDGEERISE